MAAKNTGIYYMKSVCVLGLGWLGKQIVNNLIEEDHMVYGVNRSVKTDLQIKQWSYDIDFLNIETLNELKEFKFDFLIVTIPPSSSESYPSRLIEFTNGICNQNLKIIYTSSTSMYGSEARDINEDSLVKPITTNAIKINRFEQYLMDRFSSKHVILRLAGLVGVDRHPIKFLSGRSDVRQPKAPVNLIHAEEIVAFTSKILGNWNTGVFNLCNPDHPTKQFYYKSIANQLDISIPKFDLNDDRLGKKINSNRMKELNFEFKYKNLEDFPLPNLV